ncbi:class I SAM-dependent methyltransferase [Caulobacter sp. DWP3-1-3b2]|uniref:class I SAM-dependent methyltransferase n=1 Tax=Caulobacter sp. DWP3-1-3b2 TaxID=2804643 RepID=UPI003CED4A85
MLYAEFFPRMNSARIWDLSDGDAQFMEGVAEDTFDFVFSSHCLEHLRDPYEGLKSWLRVVKPGGHLVICIPDEDLYEQGVWPSTHNRDHKHTFTVTKAKSWSPASINVMELLSTLGPHADIRKIELIDQTYRFDLPRFDQTVAPVAECAIELIIRKRPQSELDRGGRLPPSPQPTAQIRTYFNQYRRDQSALRNVAMSEGVFKNEGEI